MKKALALGLALLLGLCVSGCGSNGGNAVALLAADSCLQAARALADGTQGAVTAAAETDRAALEQLSSGACEFAVVREKSLRDALTGDDDYHGRALDNLLRLDNLLLGAFCVFTQGSQTAEWTEDTQVLILKDGGTGEAMAMQLASSLHLKNVRTLERSEMKTLTKEDEASVVMGLFLPGEETIDDLVKRGWRLIETPNSLVAPAGELSMAKALLPVLYDGMPKVETLCLYGALVTADHVGESARSTLLNAAARSPCHVQQLPGFVMDGR